MPKNKNKNFFINWILNDEIAIGPAPLVDEHILMLKEKNIQGILSLCSVKEANPPINIEELFFCKRVVLPDHTYDRVMNIEELNLALSMLEDLRKKGSIFVHCKAAIERSPLVCMAWLIKKRDLTIQQSLDYLMSVNKGTCPLNDQLSLLKDLN
ncbi:dual specificity protein phosphatase family protein [Prochlorococcus marinus XMU1412]|uniref:dual specificity protein phosphatase family protein n=1 Tax=Prochlorococcus marinus TaxID=1219 RepID=UPI001AD9DC8B|nr:dual specificity protein phosphatase [Prochlorococcus marinus]MBO8240564.1 dual specificity protein phosphatase family protein [Prochlorococcus marinus XMU1412]MBW3071799.1 phosphatase [Prochlorococcus marinus str. MU1412]